MQYYVEGLGNIPIDSDHLPDETMVLWKIDLLDLYIVTFNLKEVDYDIWIQKNFKSGTIRVIVRHAESDTRDYDGIIKIVKDSVKYETVVKYIFPNGEKIVEHQNGLANCWREWITNCQKN